jgi:hypothetical protein
MLFGWRKNIDFSNFFKEFRLNEHIPSKTLVKIIKINIYYLKNKIRLCGLDNNN